MTASRLRIILSVVLVLVLVGGALGFSYVQHLLKTYVADTNALNRRADSSSTNLETLRRVKNYLAEHQSDVDLAKRVVAESKSYQYQNDIITDLTSFAKKSGITITQFDFSDTQQTGSGASSSPTQPTTGSTATSTGGLNSKSVTVTIKSPVNYNNLLEFMHRIEQNVTKMQIAEVSLARDSSAGSSSKVSAQTFNIQVYVQ